MLPDARSAVQANFMSGAGAVDGVDGGQGYWRVLKLLVVFLPEPIALWQTRSYSILVGSKTEGRRAARCVN